MKSDTERQLSYAITSMWNPKKKYKRIYLQNVSRVMDVEKIMVSRSVKLGDWDWYIHTTLYKIISKNLLCSTGNSTQYSVMAIWEKNLKKSGYADITESLCYTHETNTTLLISYTSIENIN